MRLVDTSAWIEFLVGSPVGQCVGAALPARDEWLVPTIVQLEMAKWLAREAGEAMADQVMAFMQMCFMVPLDSETALGAAAISCSHRLATADAIVYATALAHGAAVLTCDAHFQGLPNVSYLPKTGMSALWHGFSL